VFVRAHLGVEDFEISWQLRIDTLCLTKAIVQLQEKVWIDPEFDSKYDKFLDKDQKLY
jgi:hypothetical protein